MTMFARVIAGLALGTALAGGIVALGATAAVAGTGPATGAATGPNENTHLNNNNNNHFNATAAFFPQQNFWQQFGAADNRNGRENLGLAVKDVVLGFQERDNRDAKQFINGWYNNNLWMGGNAWFNGNGNFHQRQQPQARQVNQPVLVQPIRREVRQPVVRERVAQPIVLPIERQRVLQPVRRFDGLRGLGGGF